MAKLKWENTEAVVEDSIRQKIIVENLKNDINAHKNLLVENISVAHRTALRLKYIRNRISDFDQAKFSKRKNSRAPRIKIKSAQDFFFTEYSMFWINSKVINETD